MAIKFQYNKTALNNLQKQLKMRQSALPTLQNKESALRLEVRKAKDKSESLILELDQAQKKYDYLTSLWNPKLHGRILRKGLQSYRRRARGERSQGNDGEQPEPHWWCCGQAGAKSMLMEDVLR